MFILLLQAWIRVQINLFAHYVARSCKTLGKSSALEKAIQEISDMHEEGPNWSFDRARNNSVWATIMP